MNEQTSTKLPTSFWVISVLGLIWNLLGDMAFVGQVTISEDALAAMPEAERALYETLPGWVNVVFGIAVIGGTLGCVGLLMKKKWATTMFIISMVGILLQMGHSFFMTNAMEVFGPSSAVASGLVIIIGAFLWWYSKNSEKKGWLT